VECRHHPRCPGCELLPLSYPEQLARKAARLTRALDRYPHLALKPTDPIRGSPFTSEYRHRLKLPVHVTPRHVSIGLYDDRHRVLDTPDCPVLVPALRDALPPLLERLRRQPDVHSVDLRWSRATGDLAVVLASASGELSGGERAARDLRRAVPGLASVAVSRADRERKRVLGSRPRVVAGARSIEEVVGDTRYRLHPGAFFQVDPRQAEVVHTLVREAVGGAGSVLDLYAGVGAYGLMLAAGARRVVMVEEVREAADGARAAAPAHVEVVAGKVEDTPWDDARYDVAILNPARRGADPAVLERVARCAERVVMVSCGPETLARDLDCLAAHGLFAERVAPVDLFPQTPEVETVVSLRRGPPLARWPAGRGYATGPWRARPSGATGKPERVVALVLGTVRPRGTIDGARWERIGTVAGHSLLRMHVRSVSRALSTLAARGHPTAGRDARTARFFAEKAGLVRPFVHVERDTDGTEVPLHGDLAEAIEQLGGIRHAR
jgi:23S rRNA (uracil1939-C5)-methyltransferase